MQHAQYMRDFIASICQQLKRMKLILGRVEIERGISP
jgi:hypothetical protein